MESDTRLSKYGQTWHLQISLVDSFWHIKKLTRRSLSAAVKTVSCRSKKFIPAEAVIALKGLRSLEEVQGRKLL
jgi:hypothetical protein